MKKSMIAVIICLVIIAFTAYGQISSKPTSQSDPNKYTYCELWEQGIPYLSKVTIFLNFGNKSTYQKQTEESNYVKAQKDVVDALNYMSESGWELVTKNLREIEGGTETCYLLRKKSK